MSRLQFSDRASAQAKCDSIHQRMIAGNPAYAASVAAGQTTAWATPYRDYIEPDDPKGERTLAGPEWYVNVKDRCEPVLTSGERGQKREHPKEAERVR